MMANLLDGIEVRLNTDYLQHKNELDVLADKVVYTGQLMLISGTDLELWNIGLCVLKQKFWTNQISREMRQ